MSELLPELPEKIIVASTSLIKIETVKELLAKLYPDRHTHMTVEGMQTKTDVGEQPIGQEAVEGAVGRLLYVINKVGAEVTGTAAVIAIENGLFRRGRQATAPAVGAWAMRGVLDSQGADLSTAFDSTARYEDRAVVALQLPGCGGVIQLSPPEMSVEFPSEAVLAAHDSTGGFATTTVGSILEEMGLVTDKQNPHASLTHGAISRQMQMERTIMLALTQAAPLDASTPAATQI